MSVITNLWGNLGDRETRKTPLSILKEQASLLTEITKGLLVGEVTVNKFLDAKTGKDRLFAKLAIRAPALDDYRAVIVQVQSGMEAFPVTVVDLLEGNFIEDIPDEETFIKSLEGILQSSRTQNAIMSLISQSRAI